MIEQCQLGNEVEATVTNQGLLISPLKTNGRTGWNAKFIKAFAAGQDPDKAMLESYNNNFDSEAWTWPDGDNQ